MMKRIGISNRSDLVLGADHAGDDLEPVVFGITWLHEEGDLLRGWGLGLLIWRWHVYAGVSRTRP